jgi:hypothetical protein
MFEGIKAGILNDITNKRYTVKVNLVYDYSLWDKGWYVIPSPQEAEATKYNLLPYYRVDNKKVKLDIPLEHRVHIKEKELNVIGIGNCIYGEVYFIGPIGNGRFSYILESENLQHSFTPFANVFKETTNIFPNAVRIKLYNKENPLNATNILVELAKHIIAPLNSNIEYYKDTLADNKDIIFLEGFYGEDYSTMAVVIDEVDPKWNNMPTYKKEKYLGELLDIAARKAAYFPHILLDKDYKRG